MSMWVGRLASGQVSMLQSSTGLYLRRARCKMMILGTEFNHREHVSKIIV